MGSIRRIGDGEDEGGAGAVRAPPWLFASIALPLLAFAWWIRWDQDDAFISYRYARHLVEGLGLVWNAGQAIEGYTNFLWVLALAGGAALGGEISAVAPVLSVACFAVSLWLVFRLAGDYLGDPWRASVALVLVGSNYTFLSYATGGLETQLITALSLALVFIASRALGSSAVSSTTLVGTSFLAALATMTRPDAVIVVAVSFFTLLHVVVRMPPDQRRIARSLALLVTPAAVILGTWLVWKLHYYGDWLPHTYFVKLAITRKEIFVRGVAFVGLFMLTYWMVPAVALAFSRPSRLLRGASAIFTAVVALQFLYMVRAGGDMMEFRLLVPIIPLVYLLLLGTIHALISSRQLRWLMIGILAAGSASHAAFFPLYSPMDSIPQLARFVSRERDDSWVAIGKRLGEVFGVGSDVTIAVSPAGAIPYFSRLRTIDMIGLNDRLVAREGFPRKNCYSCVAHQRVATIAQLLDAGVHLVLGHPQIVPLDGGFDASEITRRMFYGEAIDYANIPQGARLVVLPLTERVGAAMLHLQKNEAIERIVRRSGWPVLPLGPMRSGSTAGGSR